MVPGQKLPVLAIRAIMAVDKRAVRPKTHALSSEGLQVPLTLVPWTRSLQFKRKEDAMKNREVLIRVIVAVGAMALAALAIVQLVLWSRH